MADQQMQLKGRAVNTSMYHSYYNKVTFRYARLKSKLMNYNETNKIERW